MQIKSMKHAALNLLTYSLMGILSVQAGLLVVVFLSDLLWLELVLALGCLAGALFFGVADTLLAVYLAKRRGSACSDGEAGTATVEPGHLPLRDGDPGLSAPPARIGDSRSPGFPSYMFRNRL